LGSGARLSTAATPASRNSATSAASTPKPTSFTTTGIGARRSTTAAIRSATPANRGSPSG
jgi:hypothetical protein